MIEADGVNATPFDDAMMAARLCAVDPSLGGLILRGGGGARDAVLTNLRAMLGQNAPICRVPVNVDEESLTGGLDLAATLSQGRRMDAQGLLAEACGGVIVVPLAERMTNAVAGHIAAAIDADGGFLTVLLDDGMEEDARPPEVLRDRLAFWVDLSDVRAQPDWPECRVRRDSTATLSDDAFAVVAATANALGVSSPRAMVASCKAARAAAILAEEAEVSIEALTLALRLVLGPRATRLPVASDPQPQGDAPHERHEPTESDAATAEVMADTVLDSVTAELPPDVLARIRAGAGGGRTKGSGLGTRRSSDQRGRPVGARPGLPRNGKRLALIDTLRAAAPWQSLRARDDKRIAIRRDDLRVRRFENRAETLTIFTVDASGSSALARLAEAKGAVELMLAESYVRREEVALIAFRGTGAELLLPPTRSLTRARRALAELPGGGGTPLAAGLDLARSVADAARAKGRTPAIVVLTDGRANVGSTRAAAVAEAESAARAIALARISAVMIDISPRPRREGAAIADAMQARYLPLPNADAATVHAAVRAGR